MTDAAELERRLGCTFRSQELLHHALVHGSWVNEAGAPEGSSNERLEFLGDAVLGLVVTRWLYERDPEADEGRLTRLRSALVRRETLAAVARELGLGRHLLLGHGEEQAGGRERDVNLCNALEAVIGALYLDQGLKATQAFVRRLWRPLVDARASEEEPRDYKSRLQEVVQAQQRRQPLYTLLTAEGPDHDRLFTVQVWVGQEVLGQGQGRSKRLAEMEAAREALLRLAEAGGQP